MNRSHSQANGEVFDLAWSLSKQGRKQEAAMLCEEMVRAGYAPAHLAYALPTPIGYVHMARALMKQGESSYPAALKSLQAASQEGSTPQLSLAYAAFHETSANPDLEQARRYYLKAALQGRFKGLGTRAYPDGRGNGSVQFRAT